MKVFVGGIMMEANSFNPVLADCDTFRRRLWVEGEQLEKLRPATLEISGIYEYFDTLPDAEVVPGFFAMAESSGPMMEGEFVKLVEHLLKSLKNAGQVDGVLLVLHGAMQGQAVDDCEGYILKHVREIVGEDVPIVSSFDLHACMTREMMQCLDGLAGYLTMPHSDNKITGYRAAGVLANLLRTGAKPAKLLKRLPLIMPIHNTNSAKGPMVRVLERFGQLLAAPGVLSAGIFVTQPWLDTPQLGCEVCVFFEDEAMRDVFQAQAEEVLSLIWNNRDEFYPDIPDAARAIELCKGMEKPACLVDLGDSVPAGSTGDSTAVLRALLDANPDETYCVVLKDPDTVQKACEIGEGGRGSFMIGGSDREGFNCRVAADCRVVAVNTELFKCLGPLFAGTVVNSGTRALLKTGSIYIIACEHACTSADQNMLITMGLDPRQIGVNVQKASNSFKDTYKDVIRSHIYAQTPGYSDPSLTRLPFKRVTRPIYPLDDIKNLYS